MTQTQHTPGPWRVFDAFTDVEIVTDRPTAHETESLVQFKGQRNVKANARVMAAAPELIDALRIQTEAAQAVIDAWERGDLAGAVRVLNASIPAARDAIAKATRRQPVRQLPPDPEGMNNDRAEWAVCCIRHFQCQTGTDWQDAVCDLLGDLMHFCDREGFDFRHELNRARTHYEAETTELETTG